MFTKARLKVLAQEAGFHACGVTAPKPPQKAEAALHRWIEEGKHGEMGYIERYDSRRDEFWARFAWAKSVIVLGVNYFSKRTVIARQQPKAKSKQSPSSEIASATLGTLPRNDDPLGGRVARYAWGEDYHRVIARKLETLKEQIRQEAGREIQLESAVDTKPLLERTLGERAGLGFIGKQTQLLSLQFGPWLFLSELITDLELEPDEPFSGSCGTCRLCIDQCPTEAIEETGSIDARKCIAYLTIEHKTEIPVELRSRIGNWVFGCDECLNVCPYTAKQKETDCRELTQAAGFGSELDLIQLFEIKSNREYQKKFRESPISHANRKQLLRNACVVLGNLGSPEALPVLEQALQDPSSLVQDHARWAVSEIRKRALQPVS